MGQKPLDIQDPTLIDASRFMDTIALMLLKSKCSRDPLYLKLHEINSDTPPQSGDNQESSATATDQNPSSEVSPEDIQIGSPKIIRDDHPPSESLGAVSPSGGVTLSPGEFLECGIGPVYDKVTLSKKDVQRWTMASKTMQDDPEAYRPGTVLIRDSRLLSLHSSNFQEHRLNLNPAKDFYEDSSEDISSSGYFVALIVLSICYGGIHLSAWNVQFPSQIEQSMWRAACFSIMGGLPVSLCIIGIIGLFGEVVGHRFDIAIYSFCFAFPILAVLVYVGARVFVMIESFISVRHLPIGVYTTVGWSNYVPHL